MQPRASLRVSPLLRLLAAVMPIFAGCAPARDDPADRLDGGMCTVDLPDDSEERGPSTIETAHPPFEDALRVPVGRGIGTMTARIPGTSNIVGEVRLQSHHVTTSIRDGFARTTIEEEFRNDGGRVLEGRFSFATPPAASFSRLALYVDSRLVEGEIVGRKRARAVFDGIVEDTVRPRDPALLEWVAGSTYSLRVFPIPAHGSRKVVVAYDQVVPVTGRTARYVLPLILGSEPSEPIEDLSVTVRVSEQAGDLASLRTEGYDVRVDQEENQATVSFTAADVRPSSDFVVAYDRTSTAHDAVVSFGDFDGQRFAAIRFTAVGPEDGDPPSKFDRPPERRVVVLDRSYGQSQKSLDAQRALARALVHDLAPGRRFALLACDSACSSFPESGFAEAEGNALREADGWMARIVTEGSSDLAGALWEGIRRGNPADAVQLVVLTDGIATSGELSAANMARRTLPLLGGGRRVDLRLLGVGASIDENRLTGLARELGGTYRRVEGASSVRATLDETLASLRKPVLLRPVLTLPEGLTEIVPSGLPNLETGREMVVFAKLNGELADKPITDSHLADKPLVVAAEVDGQPFRVSHPVVLLPGGQSGLAPLPRLWAQSKIADLEAASATPKDIEAVSRTYHVLSTMTSLLVLENDQMFSDFGVARTLRTADPSFDPPSNVRPDRSEDSSRDGLGSGLGAGSGHGRLAPSHTTRAPAIRAAMTTVIGRLPPETIQRIVRQNWGRFRACYENGLRKNPDLAGRVAVRFVIGRDGLVYNAKNNGSDLLDPDTLGCLIHAFLLLRFPPPTDGGVVTVLYPIVFSSDGTRPNGPPSWTPEERAGRLSDAEDAERNATSAAIMAELLAKQEQAAKREAEERAAEAAAERAADALWLAQKPPPAFGWHYSNRCSAWRPPPPSIVHRTIDDPWPRVAEAAIDQLRSRLAAAPLSRARHQKLIRTLLSGGRNEEALEAARRYAALDSDASDALELLAYAQALTGDGRSAATTIDAETELEASQIRSHRRAMQGFEALGDARRACAHRRSIAELSRHPDPIVTDFLTCPEASEASDDNQAHNAHGILEASVHCSSESARGCPSALIVQPSGSVRSPWTPLAERASAPSVVVARLSDGVFRTLLVGGDPAASGTLELRARGTVHSFAFGSSPRPGVVTTVSRMQ